MGHGLGMALSVLAASLGWISYAQVAVLLAADLAVTYWFTRRRTLEARGVVQKDGLRYSSSVNGRTVREVVPVKGQPLSEDDRRFIATTGDWFIAFCVVFLIAGGLAFGEGLLTSWWQVALWLALATQLAVAEHLAHRAWRDSGAHLTADPTHQSGRDILAGIGVAFVGFGLGGILGGGRFAAVALTVLGALLDGWRRKDIARSTEMSK